MNVTINVLGIQMVLRELGGYQKRLEDLTPAWEKIAQDLMALEKEVWASNGNVLGTPWEALPPGYVARKARLGLHLGILEATGALRESLTEENSPDMILLTEKNSLTFGTARKVGSWYLGPIHQEPVKAAVPRRPMLPTSLSMLPPGRLDRWLHILGAHLAGGAE
jgi:hypothetical protein